MGLTNAAHEYFITQTGAKSKIELKTFMGSRTEKNKYPQLTLFLVYLKIYSEENFLKLQADVNGIVSIKQVNHMTNRK